MKKVISILLAVIILGCTFTSCASKTDNTSPTVKSNSKNAVKIPEIIETDIESAKSVLTSLGLVPIIIEEYGEAAKGYITAVSPDVGLSVEKGSSVTLTVSKGYKLVTSNDLSGTVNFSATGNGYEFTKLTDIYDYSSSYTGWEIYYATIEEGILNLSLVISGVSSEYSNVEDSPDYENFIPKSSNCICSSSPNYESSIPISCSESDPTFQGRSSAGIGRNFINHTILFTIPLEDLNVSQPNTLYIKMPFIYRNIPEINYSDYVANFTVNFSWQDMKEYYANGGDEEDLDTENLSGEENVD